MKLLRLAFELGVAVFFFAVAWSAYSGARDAAKHEPTTNAMAAGAFLGGSFALLMSAQTLLQWRKKEGQ